MSELQSNTPIITLTTDFGTQDWFVGAMKGVIAGILPNAHVIDITHDITPGLIREGAFVFKQSSPWFPKGSIHVVVVDPGVGTSRKAIVLKTAHCYCVGPDNGVFSWAIKDDQIEGIFEIQPDKLNPDTSQTFHGRDLFAPAAAKLAKEKTLCNWAVPCHDFLRISWPSPQINQQQIKGEILHMDRFGNMITNLPSNQVLEISNCFTFMNDRFGRLEKVEAYPTYGKAPKGIPCLITGSTGYLEWAIPNDNAARVSGWKVGDSFHLTPERPGEQ